MWRQKYGNVRTVFSSFDSCGCACCACLCGSHGKKVFGFSEGNDRMAKLSASIRSGANAFLKRQYTVVAIIFVVVALILGVMAITGNLSPFVPFAFLTGGIYSALAGFVGMKIATSSNARTANACQSSLNKGLKVAFSAVRSWASPLLLSAFLTFRFGSFFSNLYLSSELTTSPTPW